MIIDRTHLLQWKYPHTFSGRTRRNNLKARPTVVEDSHQVNQPSVAVISIGEQASGNTSESSQFSAGDTSFCLFYSLFGPDKSFFASGLYATRERRVDITRFWIFFSLFLRVLFAFMSPLSPPFIEGKMWNTHKYVNATFRFPRGISFEKLTFMLWLTTAGLSRCNVIKAFTWPANILHSLPGFSTTLWYLIRNKEF